MVLTLMRVRLAQGAPDILAALLSHLADQIATYCCYQIESGAHCIQLFDSWGGQLPPAVRPHRLQLP